MTDNPTNTTASLLTAGSDILWMSCGTLVLLLGCVGHLLTMVTILKSKHVRSQCYGVLMAGLSFAGLQTLLSGMLRLLVLAYTGWLTDLRATSRSGCRVHTLWTHAAVCLDAWLQASIAVDRMFAVYYKNRYHEKGTWQTGIKTFVVFFVLSMGVNAPTYFFADLDSSRSSCTFVNILGWHYAHFLVYPLVPSITIIVSNVLVWRKAARDKLSALTSRVKSLTIMLVTMNLVFLITSLPRAVLQITSLKHDTTENANHQSNLLQSCLEILLYTGTASTFYIYCATSRRFRAKLKSTFKCLSTAQQSSGLAGQRNNSVVPFDPYSDFNSAEEYYNYRKSSSDSKS